MIYDMNYKRMENIGLLTAVDNDRQGAKLRAGGYVDLCINYLGRRRIGGSEARVISLTHYYECNGDLVPDPDMEIAIYDDRGMVEALSYQDSRTYRTSYIMQDGKTLIDIESRRMNNSFLGKWLVNLREQGYRGC